MNNKYILEFSRDDETQEETNEGKQRGRWTNRSSRGNITPLEPNSFIDNRYKFLVK